MATGGGSVLPEPPKIHNRGLKDSKFTQLPTVGMQLRSCCAFPPSASDVPGQYSIPWMKMRQILMTT